MQGMLATQACPMAQSGEITKFTVIKLQEFVANTISGKRICIIIRATVHCQCNSTIGSPKPIQSQPATDVPRNINNVIFFYFYFFNCLCVKRKQPKNIRFTHTFFYVFRSFS